MDGARLKLLSLGLQPCNPATEKGFWLYKHKKWIQIKPTTNPKCFSLVLPVQVLPALQVIHCPSWMRDLSLDDNLLKLYPFLRAVLAEWGGIAQASSSQPWHSLCPDRKDPSWLSAGQLWRLFQLQSFCGIIWRLSGKHIDLQVLLPRTALRFEACSACSANMRRSCSKGHAV